MPTPTYTPLATVTLGTAVSSVTFSSIPATYRDLILVVRPVVASAVDIRIRFNSDSGSNYSHVIMSGGPSAAESAAYTADSFRPSYNATAQTSGDTNNIVQVMDYSATDKHKTILARSNRATNGTDAIAGRWANTAGINNLFVNANGINFNSGSTFNLYGVIA
jgi:hypothetical protein